MNKNKKTKDLAAEIFMMFIDLLKTNTNTVCSQNTILTISSSTLSANKYDYQIRQKWMQYQC